MKIRLSASLLALAVAAASFSQGLPRKGWLGAQVQPVPEAQLAQTKGGVLIGAILPDGSAASGMKAGDVLLQLAGQRIDAPGAIGAVFAKKVAGERMEAVVWRDGKEQKLSLTVVEKPRDKGENYDVIYDHVESKGAKLRMLVSKPKSAGKHPVVFLIQGIGYTSMDFALTSPSPYAKILKAFSDKGYVTVRLDKPGLGDSEGGPANEVDYERDLDTFRQGMKAVMSGKYDFADTSKVIIFGHSMGGCEGPIVASEFPVKGIAVYGTVVRPWHEYTIQNTRRQSGLAGTPPAELDQVMRPFIAAQSLLIDAGMEPAEIKTKFPQFATGVDAFTPDGKTMSGMPLAFWRQCFRYNYAEYWTKVNAKVLSIFGESEFIASQEDHPMIADIVNRLRPGTAVYKSIPNSDHGFNQVATMQESFAKWGKGGSTFNPAIVDVLTSWADETLRG